MKNLLEEEIKRIKSTLYYPPLPKKKQRVTARGRSGKVRHYDITDCLFISLKENNPNLAHGLADIVTTLWGSDG